LPSDDILHFALFCAFLHGDVTITFLAIYSLKRMAMVTGNGKAIIHWFFYIWLDIELVC
jgi:hypothetical protein